jgi:acyl dehydratase
MTVEQDRIDTFADATDDHQWIHVDPEKAADGPYGGTIAHGYLTLSLVNRFLPEIIEVRGISMGVNYGCDKVRFPATVPVGARVRGSGELIKTESIKGCVQSTVRVSVEVEGQDRPACVADTISRYYPA